MNVGGGKSVTYIIIPKKRWI